MSIRSNFFGKLRSAWFCHPMAILLALLTLGPLPEFPSLSLTPQASAQIVHACNPGVTPPVGQSAILQDCQAPLALETIAVQSYMQTHGLPSTDAPLIYQYGRAQLRSEIRAFMVATVLAIIKKPAADRTTDEQVIYSWLQNAVQTNQLAQYQAAIAERNSWRSNPCKWLADPDVSKVFNLNYDGSQFCNTSTGLAGLFNIAPAVPSKSYFVTAALNRTYGAKIAATSSNNSVFFAMVRDEPSAAAALEVLALGIGVGGSVAGTAIALTIGIGGFMYAGFGTAGSIAALSGASAVAGPLIIILIGAAIGAIAFYEVLEYGKTIAELATLDADYQWVQAHPADLVGYVQNPVGLHKVHLTFTEATLPDFPSSTAPPAHQSNDPLFAITPQAGSAQTNAGFTYRDWLDTRWTATTSGGWLSQQGLTTGNTTVYDFGTSFHYIDWSNKKYSASRSGYNFIVTKFSPPSTDVACPPDASGLSHPADLGKCGYYVTDRLNLLDGAGHKVTVAVAGTPVFTNGTNIGATAGSATTINIAATGNPLPGISMGGALPAGFTFTGSDVLGAGNAQIVANVATAGTYHLALLAFNGAGTVTQTLTVTADTALQMLPPYSYTVTAGQPFSFPVAATGLSTPQIYLYQPCARTGGGSAMNPTLHDNGDGTGTISGTAPQAGTYSCLLMAALRVDNQFGSVFTFTATAPPVPVIVSPPPITFIADQDNTFSVKVTGPVAPVIISTPCNDLPSWMSVESYFGGLANAVYLHGHPPSSLPGLQSGAALTAKFFLAVGVAGIPAQACAAPNFTVNVYSKPFFDNFLYTELAVGQYTPCLSAIQTRVWGATTTLSGALPTGVSFVDTGNGSWTICGIPPAGSGGEYNPILTMSNPAGTISETLRVLVLEAPAIIGRNSAIFSIGVPYNFVVNTTGFPKLPVLGLIPTDVLSSPMRVSISSGTLPAGLTFTDLNSQFYPVGNGILSGTPAPGTGGSYPLTITAASPIGASVSQQFTLVVTQPGDVNNDGHVNCTDVGPVKTAFGYYRGNAKFDPQADINGDGVIDIRDLAIVSSHLPAGTRCP